jgi:hypothetical protein
MTTLFKIMKYPQAYLVIHKDFVMPSLATLQAWSQPCQDIYVPGISKPQKKLDTNIAEIRKMHHHITIDSADHTKMVVLHCTEIPDFLYMALLQNLVKIYWLDDANAVNQLQEITQAVHAGIHFNRSVSNAESAYYALTQIMTDLTGENPFFDDTADKFFTARMWGNRTVTESMIKKVATNVTRAGIRIRLDL